MERHMRVLRDLLIFLAFASIHLKTVSTLYRISYWRSGIDVLLFESARVARQDIPPEIYIKNHFSRKPGWCHVPNEFTYITERPRYIRLFLRHIFMCDILPLRHTRALPGMTIVGSRNIYTLLFATYQVRYMIKRATWQPAYDLRIDSLTDSMSCTYYALVSQSTEEDWEGRSRGFVWPLS